MVNPCRIYKNKKGGSVTYHSLSAGLQIGSLQSRFIFHKKYESSTCGLKWGFWTYLDGVGVSQKVTDLFAYLWVGPLVTPDP